MIGEIKTEFRKYRNVVFLVFAFFMTATFAFFAAGGMGNTSAVVSTAGFNPGNIISDAVMSNYNSMSVADIQNFLTSKNPCSNTNYSYYQQLSAASPNVKWHWDNGHFVCLSEERFGDNDNEIGFGQTAAEIIYEAAQDYRINPQVLLVLLEKETSLITDPIPNDYNYRRATGYGCPDTAACSSKYYGFKNQIRNAAWLFRYTLDNGYSGYPEKTYGVRVGYHPNAACGSTEVYIENRATAALYRYTPYQPNAASLAAGYGTGDKCSSYGNRNFYLYFNNWFGSTQATVSGDEVVLPDGIYNLTSKMNTNRVLDIAGGTANGTNVQIGEKTSATAQWKFTYNASSKSYTITNVSTGKVLDLSNSNTSNGSNVQIWSYDANTCAQKWKIYRTADNYLTIESTCATGMVLDVINGSDAKGTNVHLYMSNGSNAQKWNIYTGQTLENGVYTINSSISTEKSIDVKDTGRTDGTNIQISQGNKGLAQKWQVIYNGDDSYTFLNPVSGKALDLLGGVTKNGTNINLYTANASCSQKWKLVKNELGQYSLLSMCHLGYAIDLSNANVNNGSNIQIWSYDPNTKAQKWQFVAAPVLQDGSYTIESAVQNSKATDLSNNSLTNGANIQIWSYDQYTNAQKWIIKRDEKTGYYTVSTSNPADKSLDLLGGATRNGNNIHLYEANATCSQQWNIIESAEGYYSILSACQTGYAIDLSNANVNNGSNIQIWSYDPNTKAQKWQFVKR